MAPALGNDHSVLPGNFTVDQLYEQYGELFAEMKGATWRLKSGEAAAVPWPAATNFRFNLFDLVPRNRIVVMITRATCDHVQLTLNNVASGSECKLLRPGAMATTIELANVYSSNLSGSTVVYPYNGAALLSCKLQG